MSGDSIRIGGAQLRYNPPDEFNPSGVWFLDPPAGPGVAVSNGADGEWEVSVSTEFAEQCDAIKRGPHGEPVLTVSINGGDVYGGRHGSERHVVVLSDGETYTGLDGCRILYAPAGMEGDELDAWVKEHYGEGRQVHA